MQSLFIYLSFYHKKCKDIKIEQRSPSNQKKKRKEEKKNQKTLREKNDKNQLACQQSQRFEYKYSRFGNKCILILFQFKLVTNRYMINGLKVHMYSNVNVNI